MQLSEDTLAALEYFDGAVEGGLRKRNDVGTILELCATYGVAEDFINVMRTGTATWKVYSALRRIQQGDEGFRQLEEEFARQMNALREQLATLMHNADDETLKRFDDIYFGMTQGVIRNIVDLGHDLAKIKGLQAPR
ncbi:MAG: hypothetical protein NTX15_00245 [Candidatus Kapabacteria bacterium]|nr:hypothetical protein [Candidatus Kapabacteria bacterium]